MSEAEARAGEDAAPITLRSDYGVPLFLMRDYLLRLGGVEAPAQHFAGDGWTATLEQAPWRQIGSLRVGGTTVTFHGAPGTLDDLRARLHLMTMRGGG